MATIQVRELPEECYEALRRRARRAGKSLQAYMREELVALAAKPTKEEAVDRIEAVLARLSAEEISAAAIVDDVTAERR